MNKAEGKKKKDYLSKNIALVTFKNFLHEPVFSMSFNKLLLKIRTNGQSSLRFGV